MAEMAAAMEAHTRDLQRGAHTHMPGDARSNRDSSDSGESGSGQLALPDDLQSSAGTQPRQPLSVPLHTDDPREKERRAKAVLQVLGLRQTTHVIWWHFVDLLSSDVHQRGTGCLLSPQCSVQS